MPISPILPQRPLGSPNQKSTPKVRLSLDHELVDQLEADTVQISAQAQEHLSADRDALPRDKS